MSGSNSSNSPGNYTTKGVYSTNIFPSARTWSGVAVDANDIVWIFGGVGVSGTGTLEGKKVVTSDISFQF